MNNTTINANAQPKSNSMMFIIIGVLLLLAGGGYYYYTTMDDTDAVEDIEVVPDPALAIENAAEDAAAVEAARADIAASVAEDTSGGGGGDSRNLSADEYEYEDEYEDEDEDEDEVADTETLAALDTSGATVTGVPAAFLKGGTGKFNKHLDGYCLNWKLKDQNSGDKNYDTQTAAECQKLCFDGNDLKEGQTITGCEWGPGDVDSPTDTAKCIGHTADVNRHKASWAHSKRGEGRVCWTGAAPEEYDDNDDNNKLYGKRE